MSCKAEMFNSVSWKCIKKKQNKRLVGFSQPTQVYVPFVAGSGQVWFNKTGNGLTYPRAKTHGHMKCTFSTLCLDFKLKQPNPASTAPAHSRVRLKSSSPDVFFARNCRSHLSLAIQTWTRDFGPVWASFPTGSHCEHCVCSIQYQWKIRTMYTVRKLKNSTIPHTDFSHTDL